MESSRHGHPTDGITESLEACNRLMAANIKAMHSSSFAKGSGDGEREAVICAVLRHHAHKNRTHHLTKINDGLHTGYISFIQINKSKPLLLNKSNLVEASLRDVFDAITMQDHLDRGISLLIWCPGIEIPSDEEVTADLITVDLYITLCELPGNEQVNGDTAMLVHTFCQDFAIPHLYRFVQWCQIKSVKPPNPHTHVAQVSLTSPDYLPVGKNLLSSHIQCSGLSLNTQPNAAHLFLSSGTIQEAVALHVCALNNAWEPNTPSTLHHCSIHKHRLANWFVAPAEENLLDPLPVTVPLVIPSDSAGVHEPLLMSLGPNTDAVIDQFNLGNKLLSPLQVLVRTMHSSCWEAVLSTTPWNLTYKQASHLARALAADLSAIVVPLVTAVSNFLVGCELSRLTVWMSQKSAKFRVWTHILSKALQVIGLVTLLFAIYVLATLFR
ncbi:hypothetical protein JVT61DRAFT_13318 [Boletus reticuloceps]|uniref:Uncharacterized protein n=1 Tax=Boletus reticuloceps TaxID=495285 RepID=A0A8I2YDD4_9AGAM|nr:hypothetical protein JVT61DRAFT_13318 [Boletus reticuloceps]